MASTKTLKWKVKGKLVSTGTISADRATCFHETVIKELCADCGADLRWLRQEPQKDNQTASISMVHSVPELVISHQEAIKLAKKDQERLLKGRKLVLLVDLDQTIIHTTNDLIPPNLMGVYHFQHDAGPRHQNVWYHTKLRPHTEQFLEAVSTMYEMHICTFGSRSYAHTIARYLDPHGKFFSHRILSRDEFTNDRIKSGNLTSLFPCGDAMVCMIDDREDVWNFSSNLIHVKPYIFFQGTADINAPPGFGKTDSSQMVVKHRVRRISRSKDGTIISDGTAPGDLKRGDNKGSDGVDGDIVRGGIDDERCGAQDGAVSKDTTNEGGAQDGAESKDAFNMGGAQDGAESKDTINVGGAHDGAESKDTTNVGGAQDGAESKDALNLGGTQDDAESKDALNMGGTQNDAESKDTINVSGAQDGAESKGTTNVGGAQDGAESKDTTNVSGVQDDAGSKDTINVGGAQDDTGNKDTTNVSGVQDDAGSKDTINVGGAQDDTGSKDSINVGGAQDDTGNKDTTNVSGVQDDAGSKDTINVGGAQYDTGSKDTINMDVAQDGVGSKDTINVGGAQDDTGSKDTINVGVAQDGAESKDTINMEGVGSDNKKSDTQDTANGENKINFLCDDVNDKAVGRTEGREDIITDSLRVNGVVTSRNDVAPVVDSGVCGHDSETYTDCGDVCSEKDVSSGFVPDESDVNGVQECVTDLVEACEGALSLSSDDDVNDGIKKDSKTGIPGEGVAVGVDTVDGQKTAEGEDTSYEEIEWVDEDDYLFYLEDILKKIHKTFYDFRDETSALPNLKNVIPYIKCKVLQGVNILFSGVVPMNMQLEKSPAFLIAKALGAEIHTKLITRADIADRSKCTTHVIAARLGTIKVKQAKQNKRLYVLTPEWLWACNERWEKVDERLYKLTEDNQILVPEKPEKNVGEDSLKESFDRNKRKIEQNDGGTDGGDGGDRPNESEGTVEELQVNKRQKVLHDPSAVEVKHSVNCATNTSTVDSFVYDRITGKRIKTRSQCDVVTISPGIDTRRIPGNKSSITNTISNTKGKRREKVRGFESSMLNEGSIDKTAGSMRAIKKAETFAESINPLMMFTETDLTNMDKEVDEMLGNESNDSSSDEDAEERRLRRAVLVGAEESSSDDSLDGGKYPRGWGISKRVKSRSCSSESVKDEGEVNDGSDDENQVMEITESESDALVKNVVSSSESDGEFEESVGSVDDEIAEAIQREFLFS